MSRRRWILASQSVNRFGPIRKFANHKVVCGLKRFYSPPAYAFVQCFAVNANISWFSLYWDATTASCGSSGSAADKSACNDSRTVLSVIAAALKLNITLFFRVRNITFAVNLPIIFENVQTNGTGNRRNIWMPDFCDEPNLGWIERISFWHFDFQWKTPALVWSVWWASNFTSQVSPCVIY